MIAGDLEHLLRLQRRQLGTLAQLTQQRRRLTELVLAQNNQVPVFQRQSLPHIGRSHAQCPEVETDAGGQLAAAQASNQRAFKHAPCLLRGRYPRQHQGVGCCQLRQPGQQRWRRLILTMQGFKYQARQANLVLAALGITAQPEQVFTSAAGHQALSLCDRVGAVCGREQGRSVDRAMGHYPDIGAAATPLHGRNIVAGPCNTGQTSGQNLPGLRASRHGKHTQNDRVQTQLTVITVAPPGGHLRQRRVGLYGMVVSLQGDAARPFVKFTQIQAVAQNRIEVAVVQGARISRLDRTLAQAGQCRVHRHALAAPPGGQGWQRQRLPQQMLRERRQKTHQRGRLQKAGSWRVGHQHVARADHLHQASYAQRGVGAKLQRVQIFIINPLQQHMHRFQPFERLQVQMLAAHDQVGTLHQAQAQVARKVGVLKIGFVVGARGQQRDMRIDTARADVLDAIQQRPVRTRQSLHFHGFKALREQVRNGQAVLQQIA